MAATLNLETIEAIDNEFKRYADDSGEWVSSEGRGDVCHSRSCHAQIHVRHTLDDDERIVAFCTDCCALYLDGNYQ